MTSTKKVSPLNSFRMKSYVPVNIVIYFYKASQIDDETIEKIII